MIAESPAFSRGGVCQNIGIAAHDMIFADEIYRRIGNDCEDIDLESPHEKFFY